MMVMRRGRSRDVGVDRDAMRTGGGADDAEASEMLLGRVTRQMTDRQIWPGSAKSVIVLDANEDMNSSRSRCSGLQPTA